MINSTELENIFKKWVIFWAKDYPKAAQKVFLSKLQPLLQEIEENEDFWQQMIKETIIKNEIEYQVNYHPKHSNFYVEKDSGSILISHRLLASRSFSVLAAVRLK